jgi:hypothetical protein
MPIPLTCTCGRALRVKDEFVGRKVRCPACMDVLIVPEPGRDEDDDLLEVLPAPPDEEAETGIQSSPRRPQPSLGRARPLDEDELDELEEVEPRRSRPRRRRPRPRRRPRYASGGWFGTSNAGVAGGGLMMLIAVVWFFG